MPRLMFRDDQYRRIEPLLSGKASDVGGHDIIRSAWRWHQTQRY